MDNSEEVKTTENMENSAPVENLIVADEETKKEGEEAVSSEINTETESA